MNDNTLTKVCTSCNKELIANYENFGKVTKGKYGVGAKCKPCQQEIRDSKKEEKRAYDQRYNELNKETKREKAREYAKEHREEKKLYDKQRREGKDRDEILSKKREYHQLNKDKFKEKWKAHRQSKREDKRIYDLRYYNENKEKVLKASTNWRINNKEQDRILKQRYKARKKKLDSNYTKEQWEECKNTFDNKCAYCGKNDKLSQEHFVPVSKGGEYTENNIIPSCKSCNSSKNNSNFFDWYPKQEFYSKIREQNILKHLRYDNNTQQLALI